MKFRVLRFAVMALVSCSFYLAANAADPVQRARLKGTAMLFDASAWEGGTEIFPDPNVDYYVGSAQTAKTESGQDGNFVGRSLIIGNSAAKDKGVLGLRTSADRVLQFTGENGLELGYGTVECWNSHCTVVSGKVSVTSTSSLPIYFYSNPLVDQSIKVKANCQMEGSLISDENAKINLCSASTDRNVCKVYYRFLCDTSQYKGTIETRQLKNGSHPTSLRRTTMELGEYPFGGTLKINRRTTVEPYVVGSTVKIQNLELKAGSALSLRWDVDSKKGAGFAVEENLTIEAPVEVRPSRFNVKYDDNGFSVALLKAPLGVELNAEDFVFIASQEEDYDQFVSPVVRLEVIEDADGRDVLWAKSLPIKRSLGDDASGKCSFCYSSAEPISNWPDSEAAKPEYDYVSSYDIRSSKTEADSVFPGNSLTLDGSSKAVVLALRRPVVKIPDLRINLSSYRVDFDNYVGGDTTTNTAFAKNGTIAVQGNLKLLSSSDSKALTVFPGQNALVRIDSDISGNGNIDVKVPKTYPICLMELAGDNSKWIGRLIASNYEANDETYSCILFRESKNLGGPMSSFKIKAIDLGESGRLWPLQSVAISEPTRGIYVGGDHCRFQVDEGVTFTVEQRICYSGKLTKTGAGTLALGGGRALFASDESVSPTEGKNLLYIAEGALTPLSSEAFERIAVSFAEGTRIALAVPDSYEEGVGLYGMALTNEFSSITLPAGGLPVGLVEDVEPPSSSFTIPICTVRASEAAKLRSGLLLERRNPFAWYVSEIRERSNSDGTVTFELLTSRTGFVISVR